MINACDEPSMKLNSLPFLEADIILFTSTKNSHFLLNIAEKVKNRRKNT